MHANAAKWTHGLCVYVSMTHFPASGCDLVAYAPRPARSKAGVNKLSSVSVNTGVKGSLLLLDIAKAVLFLLLCSFFRSAEVRLSSSSESGWFFMDHG